MPTPAIAGIFQLLETLTSVPKSQGGCRVASVGRQISRMQTGRMTMTAEAAPAFTTSRVPADNNSGMDAEFTSGCDVQQILIIGKKKGELYQNIATTMWPCG